MTYDNNLKKEAAHLLNGFLFLNDDFFHTLVVKMILEIG